MIAASVGTVLSAAAPAAAWAPQRLFTGGDFFQQTVALAQNTRGDAAVVFQDLRAVRLAVARPGHRFSRPRRVPGSRGGANARVAIDEQGDVLVAWEYDDGTAPEVPEDRDSGCCVGVRMTVRDGRSGHFRRVQRLTPTGHDIILGDMAINHGRVALGWSEGASRVRARFAGRHRRLGKTGSVRGYGEVEGVAASRTGATVTYAHYSSSSTSVREFHLTRGGRVARRRTVLAGLPEFEEVALATNRRGDQALSWGGDLEALRVGVRRRGGRFHLRRVAEGRVQLAKLAIASSGAAVAAWRTRSNRLMVTARRPGHRFGRPRHFATGRIDDSDIAVAVNDAGRAVIAWERRRGVVAAFRSPAGRALSRHRVGPGFVEDGSHTAAIDARGDARLVWEDLEHVRAARGRYPRR